jgi:threonine dehydrogenase-like Zn-dependent dehydrogenase
MKALLFNGAKDVRYEDMKDPELVDENAAIIKVEKCSICGSDLHIYHGTLVAETGFCVGHESIGEVVEIGRGVQRFKTGDKVMLSAAVGCGKCRECLSGRASLCQLGIAKCYGLGSALQGSQAEGVMVPQADCNLGLIPEGVTSGQALLLTDNLPTAYFGVKKAQVGPGDIVAVVGLGPIGLMVVEASLALGASIVYAIDLVPERRVMAKQIGAVALDADVAHATIHEATKGHMCDGVVEAVGADATINLAISLLSA